MKPVFSDSSGPVRAIEPKARLWQVGALLRAVADSLEARFNPIAVQGELISFSRAASGHCYFSLKDGQGQIRCAMFRRAASLLDFNPGDGQLVELRGRLGIYDARGELQLVVESMRRAGQGTLFEQFLKLKARLESEGLFDVGRKRALPVMPRAIGVVTSLGAAALHDVLTALQRRAPQIPVVIYPASVQGAQSAGELRDAMLRASTRKEVDVLLLVRGGGAMEDLWSFNDEQLARTIVAAPMPVISGVGHETDFTIADFCADLRAPTPTAAAELCVEPRDAWMDHLDAQLARLKNGVERQLDSLNQRLDMSAARLTRPSHFITRQQGRLTVHAQRLKHAKAMALGRQGNQLMQMEERFPKVFSAAMQQHGLRLESVRRHLELLNPKLVLERGYAWLSDTEGATITSAKQPVLGQALKATLVDGEVDLTVSARRLI
ncbi:MAG: exodeoxyribonuclease VII large subunit [Pseudomonadota bacterium]